jgi:hypothetical protein
MVFLGGVLVSVLTNIIERRIDRVKDGEVYYDFENHAVIIGFDSLCQGLVQQLAKKNVKEIVLLTVGAVPDVRHELFSGLEEALRKKVTIVSGSRTSLEDMRKLRLTHCTEIFLLGEAGEEDRDSRNIECLNIINTLLEGAKYTRCHVLFDRQATFAAFQQQDVQTIRERIDFVPFNVCDIWAQKVFVDLQYNDGEITYAPLDREPITPDSDKKVHLVIIGMSNMGIALGFQAAHLCHFPNYCSKGIKTRITFIDENADKEFNFLKGRFRHLFTEVDYFYRDIDAKTQFDNTASKEKFTDIEFECIKARFEQDEVQDYLAELSQQKNTYLTIAVAVAETPAAIACGLYLPEKVYDSGAQILIRQEMYYGTIAMLTAGGAGSEYRKYRNIKPFGMLRNCYDLGRADDLLPMMIKYTYDNTSDDSYAKEFPIDAVQKNWMQNWRATDNISAFKAANRYCANFAYVKKRSLDIKSGEALSALQINYAALMEHNRWVMEKLLIGFRAPTKEEAAGIAAEKKREYFKARLIHEDIKPYQELGNDDKNIDVKIYDINISNSLPYMLKAYEETAK